MIIGINAAAAIKKPRTGVEEYTYQLVKHLTMLPEAREHRFLLFIPEKKVNPSTSPAVAGSAQGILPERSVAEPKASPFEFPLPSNFEIKILRWPLPFLWTQVRLAWEMWRRAPELLFIPVHILPFFHPKKSIVVIHGLEYEYWPQYYSFWRRFYLRYSTKSAARRASKIIAISDNTKNDLIKLYGAKAEKIEVVSHGIEKKYCLSERLRSEIDPKVKGGKKSFDAPRYAGLAQEIKVPYLLYLGRIETKKNVQGILEAYKILKEEHKIPHQLILAGLRGYGYEALRRVLRTCSGNNILELGYVSEEEKWQLLSEAEIFLFPSFYEGFGLPVLEAQLAGVPVITSFNSCLPEVAGEGAMFVNPRNSAQIAEAAKQIIDDKILRDRLIQLGKENVKRFSWEKCAKETLSILIFE